MARERGVRAVRANSADAREALELLLKHSGEPRPRDALGRVRSIGEGCSNVVFGTVIQFASGREQAVVVKLPSPNADRDRDASVRREAALLRYLADQPVPFKVPRPLGEFETSVGLAAIQEWVADLRVDFRNPTTRGEPTSNLVARVAAAVHSLDPDPVRALIPGYLTRRDHAMACAAELEGLEEPEASDSGAWLREHLPPNAPSSVLHGDLLGQNLRTEFDADQTSVIDWAEARLGDPAYDLAIVTRGVRKPFGSENGLRRLLDAYNRVARTPVDVFEVRFHELILGAHWYRAGCLDYGVGSPHAESQRAKWRSILNRATRGTAA